MIGLLLPRSLGAQLLLMLLLALGISQGLSLFVFRDERDRAVQTALSVEAVGRAASVARILDAAAPAARVDIVAAASSPVVRFSLDDVPFVQEVSADISGLSARIRAALDDPARDVRVNVERHSGAFPGLEDVPQEMRQMHAKMLAERNDSGAISLSIRLNSGKWLNLRSMFHRPVSQLVPADFAALAFAILLVTLVVIVTVVRVIRPMRALAEAADRTGRGDSVSDLSETGPWEIRRTLRAFNLMHARLGRFVADRTRMLAALSHDLRSPLTAMRLRLELIDEGEDRDRLSALIDEMQAMIEASLAFARGEAETEETKQEDLSALLRSIVADDKRLSLTVPPALVLRMRPVSLRRALRNLIDNALQYGDRAEILLKQFGEQVEIRISDDGPGLPEGQLEAVFRPFHRIETSRSRETGGAGLGLAIARSVIRAHGGDITLANAPEGGLVAVVRLPN